MLGSCPVVCFVPTRDPTRARIFFEELGLRFVSEDRFAVVFDANGVQLRIVNVSSVPDYSPAPFTILGWQVPDIVEGVKALRAAGVVPERFPGMPQDDAGVWTSPSGARVVWFRDPDGNLLSLTQ